MRAKHTSTIPRYQQIAIEIATRIANGEYPEGERISGRSSIAGQYNVSPETARRAFCILSDQDIVSSEKGSGMHIKSKENAMSFLRRYSIQKSIDSIRDNINLSVARQREEVEQLNQNLSELMQAIEHYHSMNPLSPHAIRITPDCRFLGRTIQDIQLWQHTGATLIAIKRNGNLIMSPGPYAVLTDGDLLYFIAQDLSDQIVRDYLYEGYG